MKHHIEGRLDVKRSAEPVHTAGEGLLGRHALDKTYHGDLSGTALAKC